MKEIPVNWGLISRIVRDLVLLRPIIIVITLVCQSPLLTEAFQGHLEAQQLLSTEGFSLEPVLIAHPG